MFYIGFDIGGTKCAALLGEETDGRMHVLERRAFATAQHPVPEEALEQLADMAAQMRQGKDIAGIGISCGGPLNSEEGLILSPPNLPGWDHVEAAAFFRSRFGVPARLMNDANACALAEWKYGAGRGLQNMVFLTFGTGLGAGLILNGHLYAGRQDMAGELGHWRLENFGPVGYGKAGSFEGFCSGGGIAQLAKARLAEYRQMGRTHPLLSAPEITTKDVFALAEQGDPLCTKVCRTSSRQFGRGLALVIDLLNPEAVVAGSVFTRNYTFMLPWVEEAVHAEALSVSAAACRILPSELGESIGDLAALTAAGTDI